MLRLSEEALERVRPRASANGSANAHSEPERSHAPSNGAASAGPTPELAPAQGNGSQPALPGAGLLAAQAPPPSTPAPQPQPLAPVASVAEHDEAAIALDGFLETMERFLVANEQVMSAYLGGGAAVALEQARRPLVGTSCRGSLRSSSWHVGWSIRPRTCYLLDHTLGRTVSRTDPALHALALMPLAMSVEILAEGASCLLPDRVVTGLRDLRAHRWLAFGEAPKTLEVHVRRLAGAGEGGCERVRVELRDLGDGI